MLLGNMKTDISCNRFGGNGDVIIEHYIDESMLNDTVVMDAKVTLKPGCSLGYHGMPLATPRTLPRTCCCKHWLLRVKLFTALK